MVDREDLDRRVWRWLRGGGSLGERLEFLSESGMIEDVRGGDGAAARDALSVLFADIESWHPEGKQNSDVSGIGIRVVEKFLDYATRPEGGLRSSTAYGIRAWLKTTLLTTWISSRRREPDLVLFADLDDRQWFHLSLEDLGAGQLEADDFGKTAHEPRDEEDPPGPRGLGELEGFARETGAKQQLDDLLVDLAEREGSSILAAGCLEMLMELRPREVLVLMAMAHMGSSASERLGVLDLGISPNAMRTHACRARQAASIHLKRGLEECAQSEDREEARKARRLLKLICGEAA